MKSIEHEIFQGALKFKRRQLPTGSETYLDTQDYRILNSTNAEIAMAAHFHSASTDQGMDDMRL